jgi:hypothetical protein
MMSLQSRSTTFIDEQWKIPFVPLIQMKTLIVPPIWYKSRSAVSSMIEPVIDGCTPAL